jgi:hypothetical protein
MKPRALFRDVLWIIGLTLAVVGIFFGLSRFVPQVVAGQILFTFGLSIFLLLGLFFAFLVPRILRGHGRERETKWWTLLGAMFIASSLAVLCWLYIP